VLENDKGLLAHTPLGTGVPPTIFKNGHSKIGLKFSVLINTHLEPSEGAACFADPALHIVQRCSGVARDGGAQVDEGRHVVQMNAD